LKSHQDRIQGFPVSALSPAFTLIEILVVIAIIGLLMLLLMPALNAVLESTRRISCQSNMRQFGIALHSVASTQGTWPSGGMSRPYPPDKSHPHHFYRWSTFAQLTPYLEVSSDFLGINFDVPLYTPGLPPVLSVENTSAIWQTVNMFLCPSDRQSRVELSFGPVNYATCTGSGIDGGTPFNTDGAFFMNSATRMKDIRDGTAKTIIISESVLGNGPRGSFPVDPNLGKLAEPQHYYKFANSAPLTEQGCRSSAMYNFTERRGFSWANGEYRCTLYNHYFPPNAKEFDCMSARLVGDPSIRFSAFGWRAARSKHPGGVNVLLADGSAHFVDENIALNIWRALATIEGNEIVDLP
jgi:prepilin-type N-terminal cleavage/methylation domain-containing protein/prepilin-type processing-associated H-X9-DG protein